MKTGKLDEKIFEFIDKNAFKLFIVVLFIVAMGIRAYFVPFTELSNDYTGCIYPWWMEYRKYGVLGGLSRTIGDYYVPFNLVVAFASLFPFQPCYIWAGFSICCDLLCVFFIYKILCLPSFCDKVSKEKAAIISVIMLYLPCILMNGALWKQSDSVYTAFVIISLYYALSEKYQMSILFWAISFAFKLQAVFFLPVLALLYIVKRKFSIITFVWIPIVYLVCGLPSVLCGRSIAETYGVYLFQTGEGSSMMSNTTNIYQFGFIDSNICSKPAIILTVIVLLIMMYFVYVNSNVLDSEKTIMISAWITWTCYMFLPHMRQRYDFMAITLITMYFMAFDLDMIWLAIVLNVISLSQYSRYLFQMDLPVLWLTVPYVLMYMIFTIYVCKRITNSKEEII